MGTKHTPTPWECDSRHANDGGVRQTEWVIYSADLKQEGNIVDTFNAHFMHSEEERAANAAFIVRAVNNHEALIHILEQMLDEIACRNSASISIPAAEKILAAAKGAK